MIQLGLSGRQGQLVIHYNLAILNSIQIDGSRSLANAALVIQNI